MLAVKAAGGAWQRVAVSPPPAGSCADSTGFVGDCQKRLWSEGNPVVGIPGTGLALMRPWRQRLPCLLYRRGFLRRQVAGVPVVAGVPGLQPGDGWPVDSPWLAY